MAEPLATIVREEIVKRIGKLMTITINFNKIKT